MSDERRWRVSCGVIVRMTDAEARLHRRVTAATLAVGCLGLVGLMALLVLSL